MLTVVEIPQWQGSLSPTAPKLVEGASRLAAMVPQARHVRVDTGDTLAETAARVRRVLPRDGFTVTVGGDCGVELEPVAAALRRYGDRLNVVWFDAHGDMNTPATSPSGAFHGMILRTLQGEGPCDLVPSPALRPNQVVLAGTRSLDPAEADYIRETGIGGLSAIGDDALLYIHVDLDVLDGITSVGYPEPGGLSAQALTEAIATLAARHEIVGLGITEYAPSDPRDEEMLRHLVPELVRLCRASGPWQIERRAAGAWPARHSEKRDGWLLRHTPDVNRKRSNSALPLTGATPSIPALEAFYAERAVPVTVQVSPAEHHQELDALLAARGYALAGRTLVMTAGAEAVTVAAGDPGGVEYVDDRARWPALFEAVTGNADGTGVIGRIASKAVLLAKDGIGLGMAVTEDGWTGIFCMATHPAHRREGVARAVLAAAARWSEEQGASRLYLQVEEENIPARALYEGMGFTKSHGYHYRLRA
ncbi:GNAT family N-acetyltransferase [Streptosporangium roseum]|uniref:Arginase/agmatinase/formimionoglutamate hydrolase arginase family-like protein n=1 Tax=Streptosporangium roseum (strain ATCC 12428 / DSM 43021 / JCM 3005 / KCTC 9067 / NCIMB 10171 / NRRL 2505 / NI 9100) TaxID=479432 RepID=D2B1J3_STRRD|nr:GNAT family N-acetyltransferase [Streptosporangium roseum]ACZ87295.1 Arginase/agmatinase/formimionoglutamate hydrolase arginase family-like protein [Streptosporangium roseum DSM 43021]